MQEIFKQAMSRFASGVCVITYRHPQTGAVDGVTISAFASVSLSPLKILFCLGNMGISKDNFTHVEQFAVNILSNEQTHLAYQFAGQNRDNLSPFVSEIDGIPTLRNCLATLTCDKGNTHVEGDHDIIIGDVQQIVLAENDLQPLLYYQSTLIEDYQYE